jgi:phosphoglycerate dehydrogenase-like enzyme
MKIVVADTSWPRRWSRCGRWLTVDARTGAAGRWPAISRRGRAAGAERNQVDASLMAAAPRLRIIARAGTGVDNVDVEAASVRGIPVVNAAGANSISAASTPGR